MARYPNGRIPLDQLIHLGGDHYVTAGTKAKWEAMRADVYANEGVWLYITPGPNAYRSLEWQQHYWNTLPFPQAASPGTSSHGGVHSGRDAMALDIGNWGELGMSKFSHYCNKHGFEPNYFSWEPWHIIDWEPWRVVPTPTPDPEPEQETPEEEEDEMPKNVMHHHGHPNYTYEVSISNPGSGFYLSYVTNDASINNEFAVQYETGSSVKVSDSMFRVIRESTQAVAPRNTIDISVATADS